MISDTSQIVYYRKALELQPDMTAALNNLAWILATDPNAELRNGAEAVRLAERACQVTDYHEPQFIGTLAAAYAEAARFDDAIKAGERARDAAPTAGLTALAERNAQLLEEYRARKPHREPPAKTEINEPDRG